MVMLVFLFSMKLSTLLNKSILKKIVQFLQPIPLYYFLYLFFVLKDMIVGQHIYFFLNFIILSLLNTDLVFIEFKLIVFHTLNILKQVMFPLNNQALI